MELKIEYLPIESLEQYTKNTRKHKDEDISQIMKSIQEFGFSDPIGIWSDHNVIVEGHGRYLSAKKLGMTEVPCIRLDHLTDEQRRAYGIMHNKTAELSEWDFDMLSAELNDLNLSEFDVDFEIGYEDSSAESSEDEYQQKKKEFEERMASGELSEDDEEYQEFLQKFEPKKTTDDCYTPPLVYEAVENWVEEEYGIKKANFVRPFYPGGDYKQFKYKKSDVVVDNPPFSILSEICRFYQERNIKYFMFAPHMTCLGVRVANKVVCGNQVIYENKASVLTSFVTNMGECEVRTAPKLYEMMKEAINKTAEKLTTRLPKYSFPPEVVTASMLSTLSRGGVDFRVLPEQCRLITELDAMKEQKKVIFGSGYLVSEKIAQEKIAQEKIVQEKIAQEKIEAYVWELSDREKEIVQSLK